MMFYAASQQSVKGCPKAAESKYGSLFGRKFRKSLVICRDSKALDSWALDGQPKT